MGDNLHFSAADSGDHRFGIGGLSLRLQHRFVKTGENNIQLLRHFIRAVRLSGLIFNIGLNSVQQPRAVNHARQNRHIGKMPRMRPVRHVRPVVGDRKQGYSLLRRFGKIFTDGTVSMGTGNRMGM